MLKPGHLLLAMHCFNPACMVYFVLLHDLRPCINKCHGSGMANIEYGVRSVQAIPIEAVLTLCHDMFRFLEHMIVSPFTTI